MLAYLEWGLVLEQILEFVLKDLETMGNQFWMLLANVDENRMGKIFNSPDAGLQIMSQFQFLIFSSFQSIFNFVQLIF